MNSFEETLAEWEEQCTGSFGSERAISRDTRILKLIAVIRKQTECLKFYADREHWMGTDEEEGYLWKGTIHGFHQDYDQAPGTTIMTAGFRARETLQECEEMLK